MIYVSGPGHGGPAAVANTYLEGTDSEIYPDISQDEAGLQRLFKQFSFPGGIPSHASRPGRSWPGRSWPPLPVTLLASGAAVAMAVPAVHKHVHQRTGGE